jgi:hypothetical protein
MLVAVVVELAEAQQVQVVLVEAAMDLILPVFLVL